MAHTKTDPFEGPDVTHLRAMLALAARARRWRAMILTVKATLVIAVLAGIGWAAYSLL